MNNVILIRYGEIHLKGHNRGIFESYLFENILQKLKNYECKLEKISGRYLLSNYDINDENSIIKKLQEVFGLISISKAIELDSNKEEIDNYIKTIKIKTNTFKVNVKRADKTFPINSTEYSAYLGGIILDNNNMLSVNLSNPETEVFVEIRENKKTYVYYNKIEALGGMPLKTGGKGLLLLSGGIDSPVAGFNICKRGMTVDAIHFTSPPYTSERSISKVKRLAELISKYCGKINLYIVPFTKIQEEIHKKCSNNYMVIILRRFMLRVAERLAISKDIDCLVTGENLAQVASQTIQSITVTNSVLNKLPILRPLISYDKLDITRISEKIGTYETSILPYEDCCTVFLPPKPIIKPSVISAENEEKKLDVEELINDAMSKIYKIEINNY